MASNYQILRSSRKTLALEVTRELQVLVRAPHAISQEQISRFVLAHDHWITQQLAQMQARLLAHPDPSPEQAEAYRKQAQEYIPSRVRYYSTIMKLSPTAITITGAKTRFGSCSGTNRLSFSWRLMQYPAEAIDYVVVHELAHIVHKNHRPEFYTLIAKYLPDWSHRRQLLK